MWDHTVTVDRSDSPSKHIYLPWVHFVGEHPATAMGTIQRFRLREPSR